MSVTVGQIMRHTRNFFPSYVIRGSWRIRGGALSPLDGLAPGDYVALASPAPCPGVYRLGEGGALSGASDGDWTGDVWRLAPPAEFLALCEEIAAWSAAPPLKKESFGAYSREFALADSSARWHDRFAAELAPYRRMYSEVTV